MNGKRMPLLLALLVITLMAVWLAPGRNDKDEARESLAPLPALLDWPQAPPEPDIRRERPERERTARAAPPPPPPVEPPKPPPAPPFRVLGRIQRDGRDMLFVNQAGTTLAVAEGDTIAGQWRVDRIGADEMVLTYLPLDASTRLPLKALPQ